MAKRAEHGTRSCYQAGCREPECVQANRDYATVQRRAAGIPEAHRGVTCGVSGYIAGHRCEVCREEYREYRREKRQEAAEKARKEAEEARQAS